MKIKYIAPIFIVLLTSVLLTGCFDRWIGIEGNYNVTDETRQLATFNRVINEGDFDVYIIQDGQSEVTLEAESNLIPSIRTRIEGSALVIDTRDNLRNNFPMKLYVHIADIQEVKLSGSGIVHAENLEAEDIEVKISGSGDIFFSGTADAVECDISGSGSMDIGLNANEIKADISGSGDMEFWGTATNGHFNISGSGSIRAYELLLKACNAKISGSGDIYVSVEDYLDVNISGSGSIYYLGNPVVDVKITGSGQVIHP